MARGTKVVRAAGLAALLLATGCRHGEEGGFVSMFDGRSLEGWVPMMREGAAADAWRVEDGAIVGDGGGGVGYLAWHRGDIADFEMRFDYRFVGEGNSGVSLRARKDDTGRRDFQSYHADLGHAGIGRHVMGAWDFHTPHRREHACPRGTSLVIDAEDQARTEPLEGALALEDIRDGDWNRVRIVARGNWFRLFVNGKISSEFREHLPIEKRLDRGMIQLQLHDPGMRVEFRNLRIRIDG